METIQEKRMMGLLLIILFVTLSVFFMQALAADTVMCSYYCLEDFYCSTLVPGDNGCTAFGFFCLDGGCEHEYSKTYEAECWGPAQPEDACRIGELLVMDVICEGNCKLNIYNDCICWGDSGHGGNTHTVTTCK